MMKTPIKTTLACASLLLSLAACVDSGGGDDGGGENNIDDNPCCSYLSSSGMGASAVEKGTSATITYTISNDGTGPAAGISDNSSSTLVPPFSYAGGSYPGTGGTCSSTLAPSASCTLIIAYAPTSSGEHSADLTLNYYSGSTPQSFVLTASGTATEPAPTLSSINPASGGFGGGYSVTITGNNFVDGVTSVTMGGNSCDNVTVNSATELTCNVAGNNLAGLADIVLSNTVNFPIAYTTGVTTNTYTGSYTFVETSFGNGARGDATIAAYSQFPILNSGEVENINTSTGTQLTLRDPAVGGVFDFAFAPGDELVWHVRAGSSDTACGGGLNKGNWGFARVVSMDNTTRALVLDRDITGGNAATINNSNLAEANIDSLIGNPFCSLVVQEVANFRNLTLDGTFSDLYVSPEILVVGKYSSGLLAIKVSGTLTTVANATLGASREGFKGGAGYDTFSPGSPGSGDGPRGDKSGGVGVQNSGGGGGGNAAAGGNSGLGSGGGAANTCANSGALGDDCLFHGGGGGGGTADTYGDDGGKGGGIVILFASTINGTLNIESKGEGVVDRGGPEGHFGGGAGGAVYLASQNIGTSTININVNGGDGQGHGATSGVDGGGGGGAAGTVGGAFCAGTGAVTVSAAGGAGGIADPNDGAPGGNGNASVLTAADNTAAWCN